MAAAAITAAIQATATSTAESITAWATVAAAVGTVGTLLAALRQIRNERLARRALELRTDQLARRAQAAGVSAWVGTGSGEHEIPVVLSNTSEQPVYRAAACLVFIQGAAPKTGKEMAEMGLLEANVATYGVIPPGRSHGELRGGHGGMGRAPGVELAFTDAAGVSWVRSADGVLFEIEQDAVGYYGLTLPRGWGTPREHRRTE